MKRCMWLVGLAASCAAACGPAVNVEQERSTLLAIDREWSQTTKDADKFLSYYAADASTYPQGMPIATGAAAIRDGFKQMSAIPGFSLQWTPAKAEVSAGGDLGYTTGTYTATMGGATEKGKYVEVWKKQPSGDWKVTADIYNADAPAQPPASEHVMVASSSLKWGDAPPVLPPGVKMAVVAGDPGKAAPFAVRLQMPAGYKVPPHWHPTDEQLTILSGTMSFGMGDTIDPKTSMDLPAGGYTVMPANMHHSATAKTAATIQINSMGPFAITYVNPADDPSQKKK